MYLGVRGRLGVNSWLRYAPSHIELTGWVRVTVPPRNELELDFERRIFPQGLLRLTPFA